MADVDDKIPSGRTVKTYYDDSGWVEIADVDAEKYKPGEKQYFQAQIRSSRVELQAEGKMTRAELELDYYVAVGVTDDVWTALLAAMEPGAAPLKLAIADDDITLTGTTYDEGYFSVTETDQDRSTDGFVKHTIKFVEVDYYDAGVLVPLTMGNTI
jgi:hypothetical protein